MGVFIDSKSAGADQRKEGALGWMIPQGSHYKILYCWYVGSVVHNLFIIVLHMQTLSFAEMSRQF